MLPETLRYNYNLAVKMSIRFLSAPPVLRHAYG